jgi:hypothetical protein
MPPGSGSIIHGIRIRILPSSSKISKKNQMIAVAGGTHAKAEILSGAISYIRELQAKQDSFRLQ